MTAQSATASATDPLFSPTLRHPPPVDNSKLHHRHLRHLPTPFAYLHALSRLKDQPGRALGLIAIITLLIALAIILTTNSWRADVFGAGAAFAAVLLARVVEVRGDGRLLIRFTDRSGRSLFCVRGAEADLGKPGLLKWPERVDGRLRRRSIHRSYDCK